MADNVQDIQVERMDGADDITACLELRRQVFVEEQGVSEEEEWDGLDERCTHFLARVGDVPVGTARLLPTERGTAKVQRVAVVRDRRRTGIGRMLMEALEREACRRGLTTIVLDAQVRALAFYERLGYTAEGPVFLDAGIPHRAMHKKLDHDHGRKTTC